MPIKRIKGLPPAGWGKNVNVWINASEWAEVLAVMRNGLTPMEYVEIEIPAEHILQFKDKSAAVTSFKNKVQGKTKELGLSCLAYTREGKVYITAA